MNGWFSNLTLPILRGPLAGKKWLLASRSNFFWGTYEPEQTAAFQRTICPGDIIYDVGAHYGYYTLLSSGLAGPGGRVFALEPSPANVAKLRRHLELNRVSNATVLELALSDREGAARFDNQGGSGTGHLSPEGSLQVKLTTLDALASRFGPPNVLKIDCEGAEVEVLKGGEKTIRSALPSIFLSTHGADLRQACFQLLGDWGYSPTLLNGDDYLWRAGVSSPAVQGDISRLGSSNFKRA